jgi:type I restriction enzyme, S subunit
MTRYNSVPLAEALRTSPVFVDGDWIESKDQDPNGDVRLIQLADIGVGNFIDKSRRFLTDGTARRLGCTFLESGDVLIARMPDPIGRACIFPGLGQHAVTAVDVCIVRVNPEVIYSRYLVHFLNSADALRQISSKASGSTRQRISRSNLGTIKIPLPPLEEQRRIAAVLDASHKLQRLHRQRVDGLFGLRQSMYRQLYGLPGSELFPLSSLARITSGYAFKGADFCSQGVHVIRMSDLNGEDVDLASSALVPADTVEGLERFELFEGDILLGMSGSLGKLGIVPCIPPGTRVFLNQRVAKISLLPYSPISRELLVESIKSREYIAHLERCAAGVAVRNVSAAKMLDFPVPVPAPEVVLSFSEACKRVGAQIIRSEQCAKQFSELQASLVETFIGKT